MTTLRAEKIERIAQDIEPIEVQGDKDADLLVVGWGGTEGTLRQATESCLDEGVKVARIHLKHICPFAPNLGEVLTSYKRILLPEINTGQMKQMLQGEFLVEIDGLNVVRGEPLKVSQVVEEIKARAGSGKGSQSAKSIH
jgi:2-oxoglutarate ferredoxin oxidoreductase subunit alpha